MAGAVLPGDAAHLGGGWIGVVEAADQIVDRRAAGIHEQQHRVGAFGVGSQPVHPLLAGTVEVRQAAGFEVEGLQPAARQVEQGDADRRLVLQLMGLTLRVGAHHAAAGAANPVAAGDRLLEQRHQPLQIAGVGGGAEHQGQIGLLSVLVRSSG